jgi:TPR repeat protein
MKRSSLIAFALCWISLAAAQQQDPAGMQAAKLFQDGKWKESAQAYEVLAGKNPSNPVYWTRLGTSYYSVKEYKKAVDAWEHAEALQKSPNTMYNLACACARINDIGRSLEWLSSAADAGFSQVSTMAGDDDLAVLRTEPRFKSILAKVEMNAMPCANDPVHRQLDSWVGEWKVVNAQGQPAGTSSVQNILGGCVIFENWTGRMDYTGKSFNFVDPGTGK